jgi:hypothetical protein
MATEARGEGEMLSKGAVPALQSKPYIRERPADALYLRRSSC